MTAATTQGPKTARDFTFIKPSARRLSEYEALTVHQQPDPSDFDRPRGNVKEEEWYLLRPDGTALWRPDSTRLRHDNWYAYRDPAQQWQRTYVRQQEQQETAIARVTEDAALDGSLRELDHRWVEEILCKHYRAWSFFDYAIFRTLAPAQREALSDTIGSILCFQSFDHLRHAQGVIIYLVELENHTALDDSVGKERWMNNPIYQPSRRLAEQIMATTDWGELIVALNLVVGPLLQQMAVSDLIRRNAVQNRDAVAAHMVLTAERDRRRNLAAAQAFVKMVTDKSCPDATHNREVIQEWLDDWTTRAIECARALAPVYEKAPVPAIDFAKSFGDAQRATAQLIEELGFRPSAVEAP